MAQYPIKMLKDENGTPFVPLVAPEAVKDNQGTDWQALIDKKLEKTNIIAGDNITLSVSGNDITINSQAGGTSDYTTLTNKPSLDTTSDQSLNPSREEIKGEISLHKIAKTGNYKDLLYKPIIPITFTDNMESDYRASELPSWQISLLQQMINEYLQDNDSINNYILRADGIQYLEDSNSTFDVSMNYGKTESLFTFKKVGPYGSIPHAFQFVGSIIVNQKISKGSGYSSATFRKNGIMIYCDENYKITAVCQRYKLYGGDKDNEGFSADYISTYDSYTTAYIPTEDYQPATKKYVDDSIKGHVIQNMLDAVIFRLSNLDNKSEFRFFGPSNSAGVTDLGLSFEDVSLTSGDKFEMSATFQTASSGCTFEITESTSVKVKLTGDDVTNGVLNPVADKVYEIAFYWNGLFMSGVVRGVEHQAVDTRNKITITNSAKADLGMDLYVFSDEGCTNIIGTIAAWGESQEFAVDGNLIYAGYKKTDASGISASSISGCTPTLISNSTYHAYKIEITTSPASIDLRQK